MPKFLIYIFALVIGFNFYCLPVLATAGWVATDDFDSYSAGVSIDGLNGGTGWAGAWVKSLGTATVENAPAGGQGGKALKITGTTGSSANRDFSALSAGTVKFRVRLSNNAPSNQVNVVLSSKMYVQFDNDGTIKLYNGGSLSYETIQAYSADTWYLIYIDFDDASEPDKYRVKIDNGSWTSWVSTNGGYTTVSNIAFGMDSQAFSWDYWIDDISDGEIAPNNAFVLTTSTLLFVNFLNNYLDVLVWIGGALLFLAFSVMIYKTVIKLPFFNKW